MSSIVKLEIQKELTRILDEITLENGFNTDSKGTHRGRTVFGSETDVPFLAIMESPRSDISNWGGEQNTVSKDSWTLLIQGFVSAAGQEHPTDAAYLFLADVEKQLGKISEQKKNGMGGGVYPDYYLLKGLILAIELDPPVVRPSGDDISSQHAYFYQPVRLTIIRDLTCK